MSMPGRGGKRGIGLDLISIYSQGAAQDLLGIGRALPYCIDIPQIIQRVRQVVAVDFGITACQVRISLHCLPERLMAVLRALHAGRIPLTMSTCLPSRACMCQG